MTTTMTKRTAKQRIERAVLKSTYPSGSVNYADAITLILAERARLKRGVRKLPRFTFDTTQGMVLNEQHGAWVFLEDILALWEG